MKLKEIIAKYDSIENYAIALEEENEYLRYRIKKYKQRKCLTKDQLLSVMNNIEWDKAQIDCFDINGGTSEEVHDMKQLNDYINRVYHESRKGTEDEDVFNIQKIEISRKEERI